MFAVGTTIPCDSTGSIYFNSSRRFCITLMRTPVVKRQTLPMSGFLAFFRSFNLGAVRLWQRILTSFPSEEQTERVCTKHLLRLCHHNYGDGREPSSESSAA